MSTLTHTCTPRLRLVLIKPRLLRNTAGQKSTSDCPEEHSYEASPRIAFKSTVSVTKSRVYRPALHFPRPQREMVTKAQ